MFYGCVFDEASSSLPSSQLASTVSSVYVLVFFSGEVYGKEKTSLAKEAHLSMG